MCKKIAESCLCKIYSNKILDAIKDLILNNKIEVDFDKPVIYKGFLKKFILPNACIIKNKGRFFSTKLTEDDLKKIEDDSMENIEVSKLKKIDVKIHENNDLQISFL